MIDSFLDTNILLYAASSDAREAQKAEIARTLIVTERFGVSVQVLQEFYVNANGKLAQNIPTSKLEQIISLLKQQPVAPISVTIFDDAVALSKRYQISYWDGAIVAAAKLMGAKKIYSEDLADGQVYDGIIVINPFAASEPNTQ